MTFDFRDYRTLFNKSVRNSIECIYALTHAQASLSHEKLDKSLENFSVSLQELQQELVVYYQTERKESYPVFSQAEMRAQEVFSQFLQHLIYYIAHNLSNKDYLEQLAEMLIKLPGLFYCSRFGKTLSIVVWVDPKEGYTILTSLCRSGCTKAVEEYLLRALNILKSEDLKTLLFHENKHGFSPLMTASAKGFVEITELLLITAKSICGGQNQKEFLQFLRQQNKRGFTAVELAEQAYLRTSSHLNKELKQNYEHIFKLLTKYEANFDICRQRGLRVMEVVGENPLPGATSNSKLFKLLSNRKRVNSVSKNIEISVKITRKK